MRNMSKLLTRKANENVKKLSKPFGKHKNGEKGEYFLK